MKSICVNKSSCLRTFFLVGFVQLSTVFLHAKDGKGAMTKEKMSNIAPDTPSIGLSSLDGIHIDWNSSGSNNIDFFIVQRSSDGEHFVPIAMIQNNEQTNYSFADRKTENKKWFYRIIQVDKFGDGIISDAIFVD